MKLLDISRYFARQALQGPWQLQGNEGAGWAGAVVIPSLAEGDSLFATLDSLAANPPEARRNWLVVVVINQRVDAPDSERRQNRTDLERLNGWADQRILPLAWVDATSKQRELPVRHGGVGLARKIGLDLALARLDGLRCPLLACLDADALVEPTYLDALTSHFQNCPMGGAVLPFRHQLAEDAVHQQAIDRYELYLRSYVLGLAQARSPYAFVSIGSAMACTAQAYLRCGGMNRRQAAEDFYFLDKLAKTAGVARLHGTRVHPAPRASQRVPFGTGRSIGRQLAGEPGVVRFYPLQPFEILGQWLAAVRRGMTSDAETLSRQAGQISPVLGGFLEACDWQRVWSRLQANHATDDARLRAFHVWFDGLRTLRLVHTLCDSGYERSEDPGILAPLLRRAGLSVADLTIVQALEQLRDVQERAAPC